MKSSGLYERSSASEHGVVMESAQGGRRAVGSRDGATQTL